MVIRKTRTDFIVDASSVFFVHYSFTERKHMSFVDSKYFCPKKNTKKNNFSEKKIGHNPNSKPISDILTLVVRKQMLMDRVA